MKIDEEKNKKPLKVMQKLKKKTCTLFERKKNELIDINSDE